MFLNWKFVEIVLFILFSDFVTYRFTPQSRLFPLLKFSSLPKRMAQKWSQIRWNISQLEVKGKDMDVLFKITPINCLTFSLTFSVKFIILTTNSGLFQWKKNWCIFIFPNWKKDVVVLKKAISITNSQEHVQSITPKSC